MATPLVAAGHRLLGTPESDIVHAVAYAAVAALMVTVALYGHATIVAIQKVVVPVVGGLMILGVFAFAGGFDPSASGGEYALGGFWQTWALSAVLFAAAPISYGPTIGDYTRRISSIRFSDKQICTALGIGMFIGVLLPSLFGAFTALTFANPTDSYIDDLVASVARLVRPADRGDLVVRRHEPGRAVRLRQRPGPGRARADG